MKKASRLRRILAALWPDDTALRKRRFELLIWGLVLSLAYYPGPWGALAWIALIRPMMILSRLSGRTAFNAAYFYSFCFSLSSLYWIAPVTPPGMVATVFIVATYYAAMLAIWNRLLHRHRVVGLIAFPLLWVGLEYFRTLTEFAFPWSDLGYTQAYFQYILQIVSVTSVHGLSLLIATVNLLLWLTLDRSNALGLRFGSAVGAAAIVGLTTAIGWAMVPTYPVPGDYKVALLQGAVPLDVKWNAATDKTNYQLYDSLALSIQDTSVRLMVWPETAAPCYLQSDPVCQQAIGATARATGTFHLVGALGAKRVGEELRYFNSCFLVDTLGRAVTRYDKVKLVPFAETVPYQDQLPFLRPEVIMKYLTFIETFEVQWWSDFRRGDSIVPFQLPDAQFGMLICFESTFPEYVRTVASQGAQFLVGITNDTWFEGTVGMSMHSRIFVTRAVENRIWIARCANTGYSYTVDPYGRIWDAFPLDERRAGVAAVSLDHEQSLYSRYGDWCGFLSFLLLAAVAGIFSLEWVINRFRRAS